MRFAVRRQRMLVVMLAAVVALAFSGTHSTASPTAKKLAKLRILVTNDDGVDVEGIDELVQALVDLPKVKVFVVAPDGNRSGQGDTVTNGPITAAETTTASGYDAYGISGTPADTVNYALDELGLEIDLVVSGINHGENLGGAISVSGTVGAGIQAVRRGIPALAVSQGEVEGAPIEFDFPTGIELAIDWVTSHRKAITKAGAPAPTAVANLNAPTCTTGEVRGLVEVPVAPYDDPLPTASDCESTLEDPATDQEAWANGFATLTDVPAD